MPLTLNQFLFLVLTILAVILVTFFVVFIVQLRRTAREGEKTLAEIRELVKNLKLTDHMVKKRIDELGDMMQASRKTVVNLSEATWILTKKILQPSSKYWPILLPVLRFGWRRLKRRRKEANHGK